MMNVNVKARRQCMRTVTDMRLVMAMGLCVLFSIQSGIAYDFTLGIFGNANMDDTIDESDRSL